MNCRCDESFEQVLTDATKIAKEPGILPDFETEQVRNRKMKQQFEYDAQEEEVQDPEQKLRVDFYYVILDMAIQSFEERFQQIEEYDSQFGFLYNICNIKKKSPEDIFKDCKTLEKSVMHDTNRY